MKINLNEYENIQTRTLKQLKNHQDDSAAFIEKINKLLTIKGRATDER